MFKRMLIANRGEIAVRIIRTCKEMGIETVAVYSTADKDALHVQLADQAVCIGKPRSNQSYLNIPNILSAACLCGCDSIHPGFGFLSENSSFARQVSQCGLTFVGPNPDVMDLMGDKAQARDTMKKAKVATIPGSEGVLKDAVQAIELAESIGYPVLLKAVNGGGGRGMRVVANSEQMQGQFETAYEEATNAFGDGSLYLEKFLVNPRHIEVQILADEFGHVLHCFERDCSLQRRNQKVMEESPSSLHDALRQQIIDTALRACQAVGYDSVGTVEFLVDEQDHFYFIEMNTRIQVEHTVSEEVTGLDLIRHQIRSAAHLPLKISQEQIQQKHYAMECRINAEDLKHDFAPGCGKISFMNLPGGRNVRLDTAVYNGYTIPPYYDSMIAKLIVRGDSRIECIRRMRQALEEFIIEGICTNIEFQYLLLHQKEVLEGKANTGTIEQFVKELKADGTVI